MDERVRQFNTLSRKYLPFGIAALLLMSAHYFWRGEYVDGAIGVLVAMVGYTVLEAKKC